MGIAIISGKLKYATLILIYSVRGDLVIASALNKTESAKVVCVVETQLSKRRTNLVTLPGGLKITPYHPVFVQVACEMLVKITCNTKISCDRESGNSPVI